MDEQGVRLDKWLWAARFFKTRRLAVEAINGGKVQVDGARAKPGKTIRPGARVAVRKGPYEHTVDVLEVSERRGPAPEAALLYEETPESRAAVDALRSELKAHAAAHPISRGRPDKKERRQLRAFKAGGGT